MKYQCLIVDDELELAKATMEYFQMFDLSSFVVGTYEECIQFFKENETEVILLDINLGNSSGFNLCKEIRERFDTPILFISARQSDDDVLIALNIGGDDYIKKPYSLSILTAKVKNIIKRNHKANQNVMEYHDFQLFEETMKVFVNGKEFQLKNKEFKLLAYLFKHKNKIVTKDELFSSVWEDEFFSDGTLNVHIRHLREKIEEDPNNPKYIKTIWGTGYILEI